MSESLSAMTEAEFAERQDAHPDELDSTDGAPVEGDASPRLSVTMSFRLPGDEADAIREAAAHADLSLSEWIRQACADALRPGAARKASREVEELLEQAMTSVDAIRERLDRARTVNRGTTAGSGA